MPPWQRPNWLTVGARAAPASRAASRSRSERARWPKRCEDVVVVLPGIMGSVLRDADGDDVWKLSGGFDPEARARPAAQASRRCNSRRASATTIPATASSRPGSCRDMHVIPGIWTVTIGYERLHRWFTETFDVVEADPGVDPERDRELRALPVRLAALEPVQRQGAAADGRAGARTVPQPAGERGRQARVRRALDGWARRALLRRRRSAVTRSRRRSSRSARRIAVRSDALGFARQRCAQGDRPDRDRPHAASPAACPRCTSSCPEYACIESPDGLRKTTETHVAGARHGDGGRRDALPRRAARRRRPRTRSAYASHPILARTQPTPTTARLADGRVEAIRTIRNDRGEDEDQKGDGTVPRLSAAPYGVAPTRRSSRYVMEKHGALPKNDAALVELGGVLTGSSWRPREAPMPIGVECEDVLVAGEALAATFEAGDVAILEASIVGVTDAGRVQTTVPVTPGERSRPRSRRRSRARLLRAARPFDASRARHRRDALRRPRPRE